MSPGSFPLELHAGARGLQGTGGRAAARVTPPPLPPPSPPCEEKVRCTRLCLPSSQVAVLRVVPQKRRAGMNVNAMNIHTVYKSHRLRTVIFYCDIHSSVFYYKCISLTYSCDRRYNAAVENGSTVGPPGEDGLSEPHALGNDHSTPNDVVSALAPTINYKYLWCGRAPKKTPTKDQRLSIIQWCPLSVCER